MGVHGLYLAIQAGLNGLARSTTELAWPDTKDSGPFSGLASHTPYQAWHNPFGGGQLGPMVSPISPARHDMPQ
jgi:hypothetical protein